MLSAPQAHCSMVPSWLLQAALTLMEARQAVSWPTKRPEAAECRLEAHRAIVQVVQQLLPKHVLSSHAAGQASRAGSIYADPSCAGLSVAQGNKTENNPTLQVTCAEQMCWAAAGVHQREPYSLCDLSMCRGPPSVSLTCQTTKLSALHRASLTSTYGSSVVIWVNCMLRTNK